MSINRVTNLFVGNGSALPANNAAPTPAAIARLGIYGSDMQALNPAGVDTLSTAGGDAITFFQKLADGTLKKSMVVSGMGITNAKAKHYVPARRNVWGIGYQRGSIVDGVTIAPTGTIAVNNNTDYTFSLRFKWDKSFYSERPETLNVTFTSAAAATQSNIADQIVAGINNSAFGSQPSGVKCVNAIKVGDGTGANGLTAASNFGVEVMGLDVNQFTSSTYKPFYVKFSAHVDDSTGFSTSTTCVELQSQSEGIGTYLQVSNMENYLAQYEGISNRKMWPAQTVVLTSSATPVSSGSVTAAATVPTGALSAATTAVAFSANTVGYDVVEVATATTSLRPGELITLNSVNYEIKHIISTTKFVITTPLTAVVAATTFLVRYFYNIITIEFMDTVTNSGPGVIVAARKIVNIATPAIDAGATDPFGRTYASTDTSAGALQLRLILNTWLATTPLAPAALTFL